MTSSVKLFVEQIEKAIEEEDGATLINLWFGGATLLKKCDPVWVETARYRVYDTLMRTSDEPPTPPTNKSLH